MGHRFIQGLQWAAKGDGPGWSGGKPRGAKAKGLAFEASVAAELPNATRGQWFRFGDANGPGWCQPDILLEGGREVLILEAKLTWKWEGHTQLENLYVPVVERALAKPVLAIQVCKNLRSGMGVTVAGDLAEAISLVRSGRRVALHWFRVGGFPYMRRVSK